MAKILNLLPLFFLSLAFAQDSKIYGKIEAGAENQKQVHNLLSDDTDYDILHKYIGTARGRLGYQWQSGWRLGIDLALSGAGGTNNLRGSTLVKGLENTPFSTSPKGISTIGATMALHVGYPIFVKNSDELYLYFSLGNEGAFSTFSAVTTNLESTFLQLDLEGRAVVAPKLSIGYGVGIYYVPTPQVILSSYDDEHYMRFTNVNSDNEVSADLKGGIWGLHGDLKLIYAANKYFDVFAKVDAKARFVPKSETVQTGVYDVLNNRSLGDVSLYTTKYFSFRSGIYLGIMF
ncbi:MAG: hypothetical protein HDT12_01745 [Helicobacter sp.]|nr:hypothetical protein [Helicobacter sp.]